MRQNTKFVWMYGAILFSFALILILVAGLSTKSEEKLSSSVSSLTREISELKAERKNLYKQIENLEQQIADKEQAKIEYYEKIENSLQHCEGEAQINEILLSALKEKKVGNDSLAKEAVSGLDLSAMTEYQKYVYDIINE